MFQKLPFSMRRRQASVNYKRVPRWMQREMKEKVKTLDDLSNRRGNQTRRLAHERFARKRKFV